MGLRSVKFQWQLDGERTAGGGGGEGGGQSRVAPSGTLPGAAFWAKHEKSAR